MKQNLSDYQFGIDRKDQMSCVLSLEGDIEDFQVGEAQPEHFAFEKNIRHHISEFVIAEDVSIVQGAIKRLIQIPSRSIKALEVRCHHRHHKTYWTSWSAQIREGKIFCEGQESRNLNIQADTLDQERHRQQLIGKVSKVLASSLDYTKTLSLIAQLMVPKVADGCAIDLVETGEYFPRTIAVEYSNPAKGRKALELGQKYATDWNSQDSLAEVFKTGVSRLYCEMPINFFAKHATDQLHLELLQDLGMKSLMIVPLKSAGRIIGLISFILFESERKFQKEDLQFAEDLAARASLAIENSRLYEVAQKEIAERKRMSKKLLESVDQFKMMADSIPQLAWIAHPNGEIFWYNKRWYDYTGTQPETQLGWGWKIVHDPDYISKVVETWMASISSGKAFEMEVQIRGADGSFRWFLSRATPLRNASAKITRWFGTNTDIHDQKIIQRKLEKVIEVREEFLTIASHELRTPLTSLYLHLQMLERLAKKSNDSLAHVGARLRATTRQAEHLGEIIDGLLDVTKMGSGAIEIRREQANLEQIVRDLVTRFSMQAENAGSSISFVVKGEFFGAWDILKLSQAVGHLISNAIKYGLGKPIEIQLTRLNDKACLRVIDYGIGIASENQARIFKRFERAIDHQYISGMGLGLYISREIVAAHGGQINLRSELGKGSTFTLELPIDIISERAAVTFLKKLKQIGHSDGAVRH
jgi:PAS domain S-box-containing protein